MAPVLRRTVPGAAGLDHPTLAGGHFVQEDDGARLGAVVAMFVTGGAEIRPAR
jgi:haloalkane dehalogenase